jgi:hypothetical protein
MGRKPLRLSDRSLNYYLTLSFDRIKELEKLYPDKKVRDDKIRNVIDVYILSRGDNDFSPEELKLTQEWNEAKTNKLMWSKLEARRRKELKALKEKKSNK